MWPNPQFPADLITFTEEILNAKLRFLCSDSYNKPSTNLTSIEFYHSIIFLLVTSTK